MNEDNELVVNFICGSIVPKEIYEKAKERCERGGTNLYNAIGAFLYQLAKGEITIYKKEDNNDR